MKIAAVADLHCRKTEMGEIRALLGEVRDEAEVLVLAGDLTDNGLISEAEELAQELESLPMPVVAVLGNHDHENDQNEALCDLLNEAGVHLLNGTAFEFNGTGFVGTKGFCGGFDNLLIQPFGERALKTFIQTSIQEAVNLENALVKLDCPHKVAVMHYSPIKDTLEGEPAELFPFLGSSRLGNAVDRQGVDVIFHGHAHHGSPEGRTPGNIPVYNVCRFVQSKHTKKPYCLVEI